MALTIPDCLFSFLLCKGFLFVCFLVFVFFFYRQTFRIKTWFIVFWHEVLNCSDSCISFSCCPHQLLHWYFFCFLPSSLYFLVWWQTVTVWWQPAWGTSLSSGPPGNQSSEPRSITKDYTPDLAGSHWLMSGISATPSKKKPSRQCTLLVNIKMHKYAHSTIMLSTWTIYQQICLQDLCEKSILVLVNQHLCH